MAVAQSEDDSTPNTGAGTEPQDRQDRSDANASAANRLAARRAAKAAAKAAKKGTAVIPDEAQERVVAAAAVYERNSSKLWLGVGAFLLVSAGVFVALDVFGARNHEAAAALEQGIDAARGAIIKEGEEAPEDDDIETFPSVEARAKKAQEAYAAAASNYSGKLAGSWAKLGEAGALAELGKHAEAQKAFESLTGDADPFVAARATEGAAFALEAQDKPADAASRFEALGKLQNGAFKPLADYHRARMLIAQGKQREAATLLETLIKAERGKPDTAPSRFPNVVDEAETLLTELSVELDDPKLRANIPKSRTAGGGTGDNIMDALRLQLGQGEGGGSQLSPELLEMLQKQLGGDQPPPNSAP
jgi:hypothetical protein